MLCELHDYLEIACTFRLPIELSLTTGKELIGIAVDTLVKSDKTEHLMFIEEGTEQAIAMPMSELVQMKAIIKNVHFGTINFK